MIFAISTGENAVQKGGAEKRLENIPDFIRPMARKEVERVAKERGMATITAQVMDDVKEKFLKFM